MSRIMSHAARLSAPSGGIPMASDTAHCGQKQIRWAPDFCRGFTPTVCANMYTATDLSPASISRLQRKQDIGCTRPPARFLLSSDETRLLSRNHPQITSMKADSRGQLGMGQPRMEQAGVEQALLPASGHCRQISVRDTYQNFPLDTLPTKCYIL
jgi:hypothetical protein